MLKALRSLGLGIGSLFSFRILLFVVIPPIIISILIIWGAVHYWPSISMLIQNYFESTWLVSFLKTPMENFLGLSATTFLFFLSLIVVVVLVFPMIYLANMLFLSTFLVPYLSKHVWKKYYPHINPKPTFGFFQGVSYSLWISFVYIFLYLISLPLWILPGVQVLVPLLLNSYLNKSLLSYEIFGEFSTKEERNYILSTELSAFNSLGLMTSILSLVPFVNFLSPMISALSFSHLCLFSLQKCREHNLNFEVR